MALEPADAIRAVTLLSLPVAAASDGVVGASLMFLVLGGTVITRVVRLPTALDLCVCTALVSAAWAALLGAYQQVPHLDLAAHVVVTGLIAAVAGACLWRGEVANPRLGERSTALLLGGATATTGIALATLWELGEWLGHARLDPGIEVGYLDTVSDLLAGALGAAAAGALTTATALGNGQGRRASGRSRPGAGPSPTRPGGGGRS